MSISSNLEGLLQTLDRAAARSGRPSDAVALMAVVKGHPLAEIRQVHEAGQRLMGLNRIQEATDKIPRLPGDIAWHMIGHIQTNKARLVPRLFRMAHSVDSLRLAQALDKAWKAMLEEEAEAAATATATAERFDILLEVNVTGEGSKFGLAPETVESCLRQIVALEGLRVRGLMTMAPLSDDPEQARPCFRALREMRDRLRDLALENAPMDHLSMGMSGDFEVAIEEGATIVRVGSAIFEPQGVHQP